MMAWLIWLACCVPLVVGFWQAATGSLGPDPGKTLVLFAGIGALRLLLLVLLLSALVRHMGDRLPWLRRGMRYRRALGLAAFTYASCHLLLALFFVLGTTSAEIFDAVLRKPYVFLGFAAWVLMVPLAATSMDVMVRQLGRRWKRLHLWVYACAVLAVLHFVWLVRSDFGEPLLYAVLLILLLADRLLAARNISARSR